MTLTHSLAWLRPGPFWGRALLVWTAVACAFAPLTTLEGASRAAGIASGALATLVLIAAALVPRWSLLLVPTAFTLGCAWYSALAWLYPSGGTPEGLALAYLPLAIAFAAAALLVPGRRSWNLVLGVQACTFVAAFALEPLDAAFLVVSTMPRLVHQLVPAALLLTVLRFAGSGGERDEVAGVRIPT